MSFAPRRLGRSNLWVSAIDLGFFTIGRLKWDRTRQNDLAAGYDAVDDREPVRSICRAF